MHVKTRWLILLWLLNKQFRFYLLMAPKIYCFHYLEETYTGFEVNFSSYFHFNFLNTWLDRFECFTIMPSYKQDTEFRIIYFVNNTRYLFFFRYSICWQNIHSNLIFSVYKVICEHNQLVYLVNYELLCSFREMKKWQ